METASACPGHTRVSGIPRTSECSVCVSTELRDHLAAIRRLLIAQLELQGEVARSMPVLTAARLESALGSSTGLYDAPNGFAKRESLT